MTLLLQHNVLTATMQLAGVRRGHPIEAGGAPPEVIDVGWARLERGAPRRLPEDRSPLTSGQIDVNARTAWLLRINRLASPWGARPAADFVRRLAETGGPDVHPSRVAVWESGRLAANLQVVGHYERALGLPDGYLRGAVSLMLHSVRIGVERPTAHDERADAYQALNRAADRVGSGSATGADWLDLARILTAAGSIPPPTAVIGGWVHQLLEELVRSVETEYAARWAAVSMLLGDPLIAPVVWNAAVEVASTPGVPFARMIWDVLAQDPGAATGRRLIEAFSGSEAERQVGSAFGLSTMIGRRQLAPEDAGLLAHRLVETAAHGAGTERDLAFMLANRLGGRVPYAVGAPAAARPDTLLHQLRRPAQLEVYRQRARQDSGIGEDPMIRRLLQDALSHHFLENRQIAYQLIAASPYRESVAEVALDLAAHGSSAQDRITAALLLRAMPPADPTRLLPLLRSQDPGVVEQALVVLGRTGDLATIDLAPYLAHPATRATARTVAPMVGQSDASNDEPARWWAEHGRPLRSAPISVEERQDPS